MKARLIGSSVKLLFIPWIAAAIFAQATLLAQTAPGRGRFSLYATGFNSKPAAGTSRNYSEFVFSFALQGPQLEENGWEYGIDMRSAVYPSSERDTRLSIYDAYVGRRALDGSLAVRGGQMWLNELGGLGSFGGVMAEWRQPREKRKNRLRVGGFFGYEPEILDFRYVPKVKKFGGYLAIDGQDSRRHVIGLVSIRNSGLTERTVLTTTNFVPAGPSFFLYQGAEVDLVGPAGNGSGKLSYFFTNARYRPIRFFELQGTFHRGRSTDARRITQDYLDGRPISPQALEGLLFESAGGRAWINLPARVRIFGGYTHSKNNRSDSAMGRTNFGLIIPDLLQSGLDLNVSGARLKRFGTSSNSWNVSLGRNIGRRVYLSGEYMSSLSVLKVLDSDDIVIETRPRLQRFMFSGLIHLTRVVSLTLTAEHLRDDSVRETRIMSGLVYRFW
jgi:hypothetical protein